MLKNPPYDSKMELEKLKKKIKKGIIKRNKKKELKYKKKKIKKINLTPKSVQPTIK